MFHSDNPSSTPRSPRNWPTCTSDAVPLDDDLIDPTQSLSSY